MKNTLATVINCALNEWSQGQNSEDENVFIVIQKRQDDGLDMSGRSTRGEKYS